MTEQVWKIERLKSVSRALTEVEIALSMYPSNENNGYNMLSDIYDQLKEYQELFIN
jgi:hypothetical protein